MMYKGPCLAPVIHANNMNKRPTFRSSSLRMTVHLISHLKIKSALGLCLRGKEHSLAAMLSEFYVYFPQKQGRSQHQIFHFTFYGRFRGHALPHLALRLWKPSPWRPHSLTASHAFPGSSPGLWDAESRGGDAYIQIQSSEFRSQVNPAFQNILTF